MEQVWVTENNTDVNLFIQERESVCVCYCY
jgi:hypothetical protein